MRRGKKEGRSIHPPLLDFHPEPENVRQAMIRGLLATPKAIPSKYLYDERGSELYQKITEQPEYYLTRAEAGILRRHAPDMARAIGPEALLIELGSGSQEKARPLLDALVQPHGYYPVDISRESLLASAREVSERHPGLDVRAICADFLQPFQLPPDARAIPNRVAFFPGSTIGNFEPPTRARLLGNIAGLVGQDGGLVLGVDLKKDPAVLHAAYNDAAGVTAAFELNILRRLSRELGAPLQESDFDYLGRYEEAAGRVEMYLVAKREITFEVDGNRVQFAPGEKLHLENSYKFAPEEILSETRAAGFRHKATWMDDRRYFAVFFLEMG